MEGETISATREGVQQALAAHRGRVACCVVRGSETGRNSPIGSRKGCAPLTPVKLEAGYVCALPAPGNESPSRFSVFGRMC